MRKDQYLRARKITFAVKILCFVFILTVLSCDESFPPRGEVPVESFKILFSTVSDCTSYTATRDPVNIHGRHPPAIKFTLRLLNIFDETFQGSASSINGTLDIWLAEDPTVGKTFLLTKESEFPPVNSPSQINNGLLTLDPGETFYIEIHWEHEVEDSMKLWDYFRIENGEERVVEINALAKIQLFPELPHITTEILEIEVKYIKIS